MARLKPSPLQFALSHRYINREYSWLQFNHRVLEEAENAKNPLLERLKFLAIFESNLDEFYMVRVSGLIEQFDAGNLETSPDGHTPNEQLMMISQTALAMRRQAAEIWMKTLRPALDKAGVHILGFKELTESQQLKVADYFREEVFPLCTPLILDPAPTVPFISNRSLNLAVELLDPATGPKLARVKIPTVIPRAFRLGKRKHEFLLLEDIIKSHLPMLFPGVEIIGANRFRVIRDADIEIRELEAADLISTVEQTIRMRRFGAPVLLEVTSKMPRATKRTLMRVLELDREDVFEVEGPLGFDVFWELAAIDKPSLRFPPSHPYLSEQISTSRTLFDSLREQDILVHHPFDSFRPVEEFVASAAKDPNVIGIKQTLYRVGSESPIVESLLDAAEAGKQVAAMVELKARFDESNNLIWARALERAGVHVTYGFREMKTHCKLCLVVRREGSGIRSYAHIGTGNYNPTTARQYTDMGLFTCDPDITQDISELFNFLTGFSKQTEYRKLLVAPLNLREGLLSRIEREITACRTEGSGRLLFKLNALVDPEVIDALYAASNAGVAVDLIVRGACCLIPGVKGMSENIRVSSIVGRFLEHSRMFYFENGGDHELLIGSADLMRRNLDRRIEVLVPVESPKLIHHIRTEILEMYFRDNSNLWSLRSDGSYRRRSPKAGEKPWQVQEWLTKHPSTKSILG